MDNSQCLRKPSAIALNHENIWKVIIISIFHSLQKTINYVFYFLMILLKASLQQQKKTRIVAT